MSSIESFTKIDNRYLESLFRAQLTNYESRILLAVVRYTVGFHRKSAFLALSYLEQATGIERRNLSRAIKDLVRRNMLIRNVRLGKTSEYQLQMDVSQWKTKVTRGGVRTDICQPAPMDSTHTPTSDTRHTQERKH